LPALLEMVIFEMGDFVREINVKIPIQRMDLVNLAHEEGEVFSIKYYENKIHIRALVPSHLTGHFYAANWSTSIIEFDASGTQYATYAAPGLTQMYGLGYDDLTGHLWIFDRTGTPATTFYEYNLSTQALTGVSIQVPLLPGLTDQMNGGAFFATDLVAGKIVLGGMVQGTDVDSFFAMELGDLVTFTWLSVTNNGSGSIPGGGSTNVTVHFDATGLSYGIYTGNVEVSSNDPYEPIIMVPCTLEVASGVNVNLTAFLEGPFLNGDMIPYLNLYGSIPLSQPFNVGPWNYNGTESVVSIPNIDIADWILVELRETTGDASTATAETVIATQAGFLLRDGTITNTTGSAPMNFNITVSGNLYAVLWHRNHLGIMSAFALSPSGNEFDYDFSDAEAKVYGGRLGHKELSPGFWGMISGDGDANGEVQKYVQP